METKEEVQSIKADFSKVSVQVTFEGEPQVMDFRVALGNAMRAATGDYAVEDFARDIYYSEGEIEVPKKYVPFILRVIEGNYNTSTQRAFNLLLTF